MRQQLPAQDVPVAVYLFQPFQKWVDDPIGATERSRVYSHVMVVLKDTPSSPARRMSVSRLVCSFVSSVLRPMPVTGCSRIIASSDGVKILLRFDVPGDI